MKYVVFTKILLFAGIFLLLNTSVFSQVKGISYTFSPSTEYVFTHKYAGIGNHFSAGGQLGFGFGEYIQLNANYNKSLGAITEFSTLQNAASQITNKNVLVNRFGGEFKANLSRKTVSPFISLGTGVQAISTDNTDKNNQIYLTSGAGLNVRVYDRVNLAFEVLNTSYRLNAYNTLMTADDRSVLSAGSIPLTADLVSDISAKARISFFLGGTRPGKLSELDEAYLAQFSNGFKGLSVPIEPTLMHVNFNDKLPLNDAFYGGLSSGFDFGPYVGIRAFYLRSLEDGALTTLGKSVIWGGETKFKLNGSDGMIPYLTIGGGRIDVLDGYVAPNGMIAENKVFASGGLGLEIPLSRSIKIMGFANGLLTTVGDVADLSQPTDLVTSISYGAKVGFNIGKKPESAQKIMEKNLENLRNEYSSAQEKEVSNVVSEYENLLHQKEAEIQQKEIELAAKINAIDSLNSISIKDSVRLNNKPSITNSGLQEKSIIRVTPEELISIIREIKAPAATQQELAKSILNEEKTSTENPEQKDSTSVLIEKIIPESDSVSKKDTIVIETKIENAGINTSDFEKHTSKMEAKMDSINLQLLTFGEVSENNNRQMENLVTALKLQLGKAELLNENLKLELRNQQISNEKANKELENLANIDHVIDNLTKQIKKLESKVDKTNKTVKALEITENTNSIFSEVPQITQESGNINYENASVFGGINLGESSSFNVGLRWKYKLGNSNFNLVPETYLGIGSTAYFGLFVNTTYNFEVGTEKGFNPYIGTGLGILKTQNDNNNEVFKGAYNLIIGSQLPQFSNGRFYVDLTTRNLFKYNQLTLGYHLPF